MNHHTPSGGLRPHRRSCVHAAQAGHDGAQMMTEQPFRTIIEPFRIHSVEPVRLTSRAERAAALDAAGYNLFELGRSRRGAAAGLPACVNRTARTGTGRPAPESDGP